jgi:hypothetical protein
MMEADGAEELAIENRMKSEYQVAMKWRIENCSNASGALFRGESRQCAFAAALLIPDQCGSAAR